MSKKNGPKVDDVEAFDWMTHVARREFLIQNRVLLLLPSADSDKKTVSLTDRKNGKALIHCSHYLPFHLQSRPFLRTVRFFLARSSAHSCQLQ